MYLLVELLNTNACNCPKQSPREKRNEREETNEYRKYIEPLASRCLSTALQSLPQPFGLATPPPTSRAISDSPDA